jgi:hypothetical protein
MNSIGVISSYNIEAIVANDGVATATGANPTGWAD